MYIFSEIWMINRYSEFVNDSNYVYRINADADIKIRSAWHTYFNNVMRNCVSNQVV